MKILNVTWAAIAAVALLAASGVARADEPGDMKDMKGKSGHWDKFDMLKKKLGLSDDQVKQWKAAEKDAHDTAKLLKDKVGADKAELRVLVDQNASDDQLTAALKGLKDDEMAAKDQKEKMGAAISAILNPMQRAKWILSMEHGGHPMPGHGPMEGPGWQGPQHHGGEAE